MAGHSRSKNGVASLAYVPAIHVFLLGALRKTWMPATSAGMTRRQLKPLLHIGSNFAAFSSAALRWKSVAM
jgi:hypothetical protein